MKGCTVLLFFGCTWDGLCVFIWAWRRQAKRVMCCDWEIGQVFYWDCSISHEWISKSAVYSLNEIIYITVQKMEALDFYPLSSSNQSHHIHSAAPQWPQTFIQSDIEHEKNRVLQEIWIWCESHNPSALCCWSLIACRDRWHPDDLNSQANCGKFSKLLEVLWKSVCKSAKVQHGQEIWSSFYLFNALYGGWGGSAQYFLNDIF